MLEYVTSCPEIRTEVFTLGLTLDARIQLCLAAITAYGGGICDARNDLTSSNLKTNPYQFVPTQAVGYLGVRLPFNSITTDVPIVLMPGDPNVSDTTTSTFNPKAEGGIELIGAGYSMGQTNTSNVAGSSISPSNNFQACVGTSPVPAFSGCTAEAGWQVATAPITSDPNFNGLMVLTPVGFSFDNSHFMVGEGIIVGSGTTVSYGIITRILQPGSSYCTSLTNHCALLTDVQGYTSSQGSTSFVTIPEMVSLGAWSQTAQQQVGMYGNVAHDLSILCGAQNAGVAGCVNVLDWYSAEKSGVYNAWLLNYVNIGLQVEGGPSQRSDYHHLIFTLATNCNAAPYNNNTISAVFRSSGTIGISDSTFVASGTNGGCHPTYAIVADSQGMEIDRIHEEQNINGLSIGDSVTSTMLATAPPSSIGGIVVHSFNGSCKGTNDGCTIGTGGSVVHIGNIQSVSSVFLTNIDNASTDKVDNTIVDSSNNNNATHTNNVALSYNLDGAGRVSFTDWNPADPLHNVGLDCYNASCSTGILNPNSIVGGVKQTATTTVTNSTVATSILGTGLSGQFISAKSAVAGTTVRIDESGYLSTFAGNTTLQFQLFLGSTVVCDTGPQYLTPGMSSQQFESTAKLTFYTIGASGTVSCQGQVYWYQNGGSQMTMPMLNTGTQTIDTTMNEAIDLRVKWGVASVANSITSTNGILEVM